MARVRASVTCSKTSRSCAAYPFTVSIRLGIRSYRRRSCTSIWDQPFSTRFRSVTSRLNVNTAQSTRTTTTATRIQTASIGAYRIGPVATACR